MKTKEEILKINVESIAKCSVKYNVTHQGILNAMDEYATQCQEDMADERKMIMETLLKIRDCKDYGNNSSTLAKELINSLNKQD